MSLATEDSARNEYMDMDMEKLSVVCTSCPHMFGSRSFSVAAPTIWNSLPFDIRNSCSIASFSRKLKTFFFFQRLAMSSAPSLLPQRLRFGESLADIARSIN